MLKSNFDKEFAKVKSNDDLILKLLIEKTEKGILLNVAKRKKYYITDVENQFFKKLTDEFINKKTNLTFKDITPSYYKNMRRIIIKF